MEKGEPPARQQKPEDVAEHGRGARVLALDDRTPERPEGVARQLEGLYPERDGQDQQEHDDAGEGVADREPEPGEDQPDDVEEHAHRASPIPECAGRLTADDGLAAEYPVDVVDERRVGAGTAAHAVALVVDGVDAVGATAG